MKTVILIAQYYLKYYNFEQIKKMVPRLVLIVDKCYFANLSVEIKQYFAQIHIVKIAGCEFFPTFDINKVRKIVDAELQQHNQVRLIAHDESAMMMVARLREEFNLSGIYPETMLLFRDKLKMKDKLTMAKIMVPRYFNLADVCALQNERDCIGFLQRQLKFPFVVKPVESEACVNVSIIHSIQEFQQFVMNNETWHTNYEAEEFVHGKIYHCDSAVYKGKIVFSECCEYIFPPLECIDGALGGSMPLREDDPLRTKILTFAAQVLHEFGMINTVSHMEIIVTPQGKPVFLEVGARVPGGMIIPCYLKQFGVNLINLHFLIQMEKLEFREAKKQTNCFSLFVPARGGVVESLNVPKLQSKFELKWQVRPGQKVTGKSLMNRLATLLVWNDDYEVLRQDYIAIKKHTFVDYLV